MSNGDVSALDFSALGGAPADFVNATNVDFYLTVGGDVAPVGNVEAPPLDSGGVPYGGVDAAGYTSIADVIRSGGDPESYIASVNAGSTADILRSGGDSPGFDPAAFNPNAPTQAADWNITDLFAAITKGVATIGATTAVLLNATKGSPSSGQRAPSGAPAGGPSLAQRFFGGLTPGPGGAPPSTMLWGSLALVGMFLLFMLLQRKTA
jgi:hypothetical protein